MPVLSASPETETLSIGRVLWQEMDGHGGLLCCAATDGHGPTLCGTRVFDPEEPTLATPSFLPTRVACPDCTKKLHEVLPEQEFRLLPVEALGADLSVRAVTVLKRLFRRGNITVGDLATIGSEDVFMTRACGVTTLGVLECAMRKYGLSFAPGVESLHDQRRAGGFKAVAKDMLSELKRVAQQEKRRVRSEVAQKLAMSRLEKKRIRRDAVVANFLEKVGPELLKVGTLDEMGSKLGLSRERVRQLINAYPALQALRGAGGGWRQERRRSQLEDAGQVARRLVCGESLASVAKELGKTPYALRAVGTRNKEIGTMLDFAMETSLAIRRKKKEDRVLEIANYAIENNLSFKGACDALGYKHLAENTVKIRFLKEKPEILENQAYKRVLDPRAVINEEFEVVRRRMLDEGMSFSRATAGLGSCSTSLRLRVEKDPDLLSRLRRKRR